MNTKKRQIKAKQTKNMALSIPKINKYENFINLNIMFIGIFNMKINS